MNAIPNENQFPERLKALRGKSGLSRKGLADRIGVSLVALWSWENGTRAPREDNVRALAQALSIPYQYLRDGYLDDSKLPDEYLQSYIEEVKRTIAHISGAKVDNIIISINY